jgi:hypothetical protein
MPCVTCYAMLCAVDALDQISQGSGAGPKAQQVDPVNKPGRCPFLDDGAFVAQVFFLFFMAMYGVYESHTLLAEPQLRPRL